jgi:tetratricopeptide (TPR) repeat protein
MADPAPTRTYRLVDVDPTGFGLGERKLSPFVGRELEFTLLLDRFWQVRASGHGHVVGLKGEPGAGKSRLLFEFRQRLASEHVRYVAGSCVSHGAGTPYLPLVDLLRRALSLDPDSPAESIADRVHAALTNLALDADALAPFLLALVGGRGAAANLEHLSPEAVRLRTFDALYRVLLALAHPGPVVVFLEDLHWIDRTSDAFLEAFIDTLPGAAALVVVTARPGHDATWLARSYASQLALAPLSQQDARTIVSFVLPQADRAEPLHDQIVARADGNPFFLEELSWTVVDGDGRTDVAVPVTVTAALGARMDRLPEAPRRLLETAAVIGREVPTALLEAITGDTAAALSESMRPLVTAEFLFERPGPAFVFKHALTQDVAYARVPVPERQLLHTAIGGALERLHADRTDEVLGQLAHHWARTPNDVKAIHYLARLAQRAGAAYSLDETLAALDAADARAQTMPAGRARDVTIVDLLTRRALPLIHLGRFAEIRDRFHSARATLERLGTHPLTAPLYVLFSLALDQLGERTAASAAARQAVREAEGRGDALTVGKACLVLSLGAFWSGSLEEGVECARRGIPLLEGSTETWWLGHLHWILGVNAATGGALDLARRASRETVAVGKRSADRRLDSYGYWLAGWVDVLDGHHEAGLAACREAFTVAPDPLAKAVAALFLGFANLEAGFAEAAVPLLRGATEQFSAFRHPALQAWAAAWLSDALRAQGQADEATTTARRALQISEATEFPYPAGLARRVLGRVALAGGERAEAATRLQEALEVFTRIDARYDVAQAHLDLATVAHTADDMMGARRHLAAAHRLFAVLDLPRRVQRTEACAVELGLAIEGDGRARELRLGG